jgi:hypothetical protein
VLDQRQVGEELTEAGGVDLSIHACTPIARYQQCRHSRRESLLVVNTNIGDADVAKALTPDMAFVHVCGTPFTYPRAVLPPRTQADARLGTWYRGSSHGL